MKKMNEGALPSPTSAYTLRWGTNLDRLGAFGWWRGGGGRGLMSGSGNTEKCNEVLHYPGYVADGVVDLGVHLWVSSVNPPAKGHHDNEKTILPAREQLPPVPCTGVILRERPLLGIPPLWLGLGPPIHPSIFVCFNGLNSGYSLPRELPTTYLEPVGNFGWAVTLGGEFARPLWEYEIAVKKPRIRDTYRV